MDYGGRRVSFCVLEPDSEPRIWHHDYRQAEPFDPKMYDDMWIMIRDTSESLDVGYWCVESPIAGASGNVQTALKMAMTAGALMAGIGYSSHVDMVPPSTWKKEVTGHGNTDKAGVGTWLHNNWPQLWATAVQAGGRASTVQDCFDATCLALCAAARCSVETASAVPG